MSALVAYTPDYLRRVARVLRGDAREAMELAIAANPAIHPVVAGTGGVRKARWALPGRGKRGGIRVIYFFRSTANVVYFLDVYAKSERADLNPEDKKILKAIVNQLGGIQ